MLLYFLVSLVVVVGQERVGIWRSDEFYSPLLFLKNLLT
jgi:hypothetical protein